MFFVFLGRGKPFFEFTFRSKRDRGGIYLSFFYLPSHFFFQVKSDGCCPSKVIHIRGLPVNVNEQDVKDLGLPFGKVTNVLLMRTKSQAFLELQDVESAKTMINYYSYCPPNIRSQHVSSPSCSICIKISFSRLGRSVWDILGLNNLVALSTHEAF